MRNRSSSASKAMPIGAPSKSSRKIASPGARSAALSATTENDFGEGSDCFMQSGGQGNGHVGFGRILLSRPRSNRRLIGPSGLVGQAHRLLRRWYRQAVRLPYNRCRALVQPFASRPRSELSNSPFKIYAKSEFVVRFGSRPFHLCQRAPSRSEE